MSIKIAAVNPDLSPDLAEYIANRIKSGSIKTIVVDFDDAFYHFQTGLHDQIKNKILAEANNSRDPGVINLRKKLAQDKGVSAESKIEADDLARLFPPIVNLYRQKSQSRAELMDYLRRVYDVDYSVIAPQPDFVAAFDKLNHHVRFVLYTHGPFKDLNGRPLHVMNALRQIGFARDAFSEEDVFDLLKTDRNPDLLRYHRFKEEEQHRIYAKPDKEAFWRMCKAAFIKMMPSKFPPSYPDVLFIDDSAANLAAAKHYGAMTIQISPHPHEALPPELQQAVDYRVWSDNTDSAGRPYSTLGFLLQEVAAFFPALAANNNHSRHQLLKPGQ